MVRDLDGHITGFDGVATFVATAGTGSVGIDGGLTYGPDDVLFFTTFADNKIGQLKPGSTTPDHTSI